MPQTSQLGELSITNVLVGLLLLTGAMDFQSLSLGTTGIRQVILVPSV